MTEFSKQSEGYKVGMGLLFLCTIAVVVGTVPPFWGTGSFGNFEYYEGLLLRCEVSPTRFLLTTSSLDLPILKYAARPFLIVGVICLVVACVYGLGVMCNYPLPGPSRLLEIFAACGGVLCFTASMLYMGLGVPKTVHILVPVTLQVPVTLAWGFYLTAVASPLTIVAAAVIALFYLPVEVGNIVTAMPPRGPVANGPGAPVYAPGAGAPVPGAPVYAPGVPVYGPR